MGNLFQIFRFMAGAFVVGIPSKWGKRRLRGLHQGWNLASRGRATVALFSEIHGPLTRTRDSLRKESVSEPSRSNLRRIMEKLGVLGQSLDPSIRRLWDKAARL